MKVHSFYDAAGMLAVDCTECTRGCNGSAEKCASGWRYKKGGFGYCYVGTLIPGIIVPKSTKIPSKAVRK